MHDHNPTVVPHRPTRWTEDRVERLMLAFFAEQPIVLTEPARSVRGVGAPKTLLVVVAAVCLLAVLPVLSARVDESSGDATPLARWVGPHAMPTMMAMNIAANDEDEAESMTSESDSSVNESDETAEAPAAAEAEESAST